MKPEDLKTWRKERALSQEQLASILGITKACVSRWESGNRPISPFLHLALKCLKVKKGGGIKGKVKRAMKKKQERG